MSKSVIAGAVADGFSRALPGAPAMFSWAALSGAVRENTLSPPLVANMTALPFAGFGRFVFASLLSVVAVGSVQAAADARWHLGGHSGVLAGMVTEHG